MFAFLFSGLGRWLSMGLIGSLIVGGLVVWFKMNYVSKVELDQYKEYTSNLAKAYAKKEKILQTYIEEKDSDEEQIKKLEEEREKLLKDESKPDDPVVLDSDDLKRLRNFGR